MKDYDGCLVAGREALRLNPRSFETLNTLGLCYTTLNCTEEARATLLRAVELRPNIVDAWANLGQLEFNDKCFERAAECMAMGLSCDAKLPQLHWWRGRALGFLERWDEARLDFEVALAIEPNNPAMWQGLLSATTAQEDIPVTELAVGRALELEPNNPNLAALAAQLDRMRKKQ